MIDCYGKRILFDTGAKKQILIENFEKAGIDPLTIDMLIISHGHDDHNFGIDRITNVNPCIEVYLPPISSDYCMP